MSTDFTPKGPAALLDAVATRVIKRYLEEQGRREVTIHFPPRRDGVELTYRRVGQSVDVKIKADPYFGVDEAKCMDRSLPFYRTDTGQAALQSVAHHLNRDPGWAVTSAGLLDAILLDGQVALATSMNDAFTIEFPDLSVIGVTLEHMEDCVVGANPGIQRYSVTFTADLATSDEIRIGETGEAAGWSGTLVEASQYPSEDGPPEVEARGTVYITFLRES